VTSSETAIPARRTSAATTDAVLFTLVIAAAVSIGWIAASAAFGTIPAQNALFGADTGRVLGNLTGHTDSYYRLKVHPWQGWICIFYQLVIARGLGLAPEIGVPALSVAMATGCAGLIYLVLRRLAVGPWAAASFALLFCSTAGFVFWGTVPESHMAGGASTLVAVLLMTGANPRSASAAFWRPVLAFSAGLSIVVTNGVVWVLRQLEFEPLRAGLRPFLAANLAKARIEWPQAAWGIALIFAVWAPQWLFLRKRIGIPFNFLEERHYFEVGSLSWKWSLHVFGVLPPGSAAGAVLSIACVLGLIAALRLLRPQTWFIPLFPLFGMALHAVYGGDSAFLFAPNYLPLTIVALGLVAEKTLAKWSAAAVLPLAAALLFFNLQQWHGALHALAAAGQLKTYAAALQY